MSTCDGRYYGNGTVLFYGLLLTRAADWFHSKSTLRFESSKNETTDNVADISITLFLVVNLTVGDSGEQNMDTNGNYVNAVQQKS